MRANRKALVLDFGGVITRTLFETHPLTEKALGLKECTLTWRGPFDRTTDPLWVSMENGEITERAYWMQRVREVGDLVGEDWNSFPEFISRARADDPMAVIRTEAIEAIQEAKFGGHVLAILTNELDLFYGERFRTKLPFLTDFELIVDATYTKVLKPDPRAYGFVTEGLGLAADQCVFVDDQLKNIQGARRCGMSAVHFDVKNPGTSYRTALEMLNS